MKEREENKDSHMYAKRKENPEKKHTKTLSTKQENFWRHFEECSCSYCPKLQQEFVINKLKKTLEVKQDPRSKEILKLLPLALYSHHGNQTPVSLPDYQVNVADRNADWK